MNEYWHMLCPFCLDLFLFLASSSTSTTKISGRKGGGPRPTETVEPEVGSESRLHKVRWPSRQNAYFYSATRMTLLADDNAVTRPEMIGGLARHKEMWLAESVLCLRKVV